jgi:arylformamidase
MRIHDISQSVSEDIAVWPGDTPFAQEWVMRIQDGMSCNVSTITMSVHCGTHTDAPYHFVESAPKMADVPLEPYIGPCRVVHITPEGSPPRIPASAFDDVQPGERILFRTCEGLDPNTFDEDFCSLGPSAARAATASPSTPARPSLPARPRPANASPAISRGRPSPRAV